MEDGYLDKKGNLVLVDRPWDSDREKEISIEQPSELDSSDEELLEAEYLFSSH